MKMLLTLLAGSALGLITSSAVVATDADPWRNHAEPFVFRFGNEIDLHQQTQKGRDGSLFGFFYVRFTGVTTRDRYRVATHVDCDAVPDCTVGWALNGVPASASLLYNPPMNHPVFLVARPDIPQPGAYSHFHWLGVQAPLGHGAPGYLLQLAAIDSFCFIHHGAENAMADRTCRENGGVSVDAGADTATHPNLVTNRPPGM